MEYKRKRDIMKLENKDKRRNCKNFTLFQLFYKKNIRDTLVGSTLALVAICGSWAGVEWSPTIIRENFPVIF